MQDELPSIRLVLGMSMDLKLSPFPKSGKSIYNSASLSALWLEELVVCACMNTHQSLIRVHVGGKISQI